SERAHRRSHLRAVPHRIVSMAYRAVVARRNPKRQGAERARSRSSLPLRNETMGTRGTRGTQFLALQIKELQGGRRREKSTTSDLFAELMPEGCGERRAVVSKHSAPVRFDCGDS